MLSAALKKKHMDWLMTRLLLDWNTHLPHWTILNRKNMTVWHSLVPGGNAQSKQGKTFRQKQKTQISRCLGLNDLNLGPKSIKQLLAKPLV